jgi:hypothetical protein
MYLLREGFCPPCHFHGRAFVRSVIFTGGLLSALSFAREGFCPPFHFLTGGLLSWRAFVLHSCHWFSEMHKTGLYLIIKAMTRNFTKWRLSEILGYHEYFFHYWNETNWQVFGYTMKLSTVNFEKFCGYTLGQKFGFFNNLIKSFKERRHRLTGQFS